MSLWPMGNFNMMILALEAKSLGIFAIIEHDVGMGGSGTNLFRGKEKTSTTVISKIRKTKDTFAAFIYWSIEVLVNTMPG